MEMPMIRKPDSAAPSPAETLQTDINGALTDAALDQVSGGTEPAPAATSNVMKTKHDTVKNSISNVR
jgi:hypothetical protein